MIYCFVNYALQDVYKQLRQAKKQTEKACGQLELFLQTFSHELRNPLNSMLGNIQLALQETLSLHIYETIESANICGEILLQLINNILDTSKIQSGLLEINPTSSSLGDLINGIWRISRDLIKRKNLNGFLKIDKKLPSFLYLDHYRMNQVLLNLLSNAIKFTREGYIWTILEWIPGIKLSDESFKPIPYDEEGLFEKNENMKALNRAIDNSEYFKYVNSRQNGMVDFKLNSTAQKGPGILKIIVKDTGCGIKSKDINMLFEKFCQVHNDPSKRNIGTGLGLYITKEIVEKMGGQIRIYSREGVGTTFIVCIPTKST
jgi:signal transduction histidine kinase